jgi:hypothetical protein
LQPNRPARNTTGAWDLATADASDRRYQIEGRDLGYPTRFRDGSAAAGFFLVDARVANESIAETGFAVAKVAPRRAIYTWKLQVTTALSRDAGLSMWGFPKTLAEIDFELSGGRAGFSLRMAGEPVLDYSVRAQGSHRPAPATSPVYPIFEGAQHASQLSQEYRDAAYRPGGGLLHQLGDNPRAQQLGALGLRRHPSCLQTGSAAAASGRKSRRSAGSPTRAGRA